MNSADRPAADRQATTLPELSAAPVADRDDTTEELHGHRIHDPYRYLEDPDGARTVAFVQAQNAVSAPYLAGLPATGYFTEAVTGLLTTPRSGTPWERGGRYFRMDNPGDADQDRLLTAGTLDELLTAPRVLIDPNTMAADGTVALMAAEVSPDGRHLAMALSEAGSDWRTITVLNVDDGEPVEDPLQWTKFIWPTWLPDGSGFLYWRYPAPQGQEYVAEMPSGELALHRLGTPQDSDAVIWSRPDSADAADWMASPEFSGDGRWLMVTASPGTDSRTTVELLPVDLTAAEPFGDPVSVVGELADHHEPVDVLDGRLILHTEAGAERGRLVAVDLPDLTRTELVGEHDTDILVGASAADGALVVVWSRDTAHRVQVIDTDGGHRADIDVSSPVSVVTVNSRADSREVFVGTTSFTDRLTVRRLELAAPEAAAAGEAGDGSVAVTVVPSGPSAAAGHPVHAVRSAGTSRDGTRIPMTVVRRADLSTDRPAPTLLYGYGGFDIPMVPSFSALFAAWVQAGGVFVVANLRGGGEFGQGWHRAGMFANKQNVFDDLYGCAEALIADGVTTSAQLAVHGRSNGGLLAGAALVQRPDLWAAALPTVGVLDMLRFHKFTIGRAWTAEYGDPDDPGDFATVLAYSPLHNLVEGTAYPPTLICTGDHDDRVVPAHSLKFGAQLLHCQGGAAPVVLRVDTRAGHGLGKPVRALAAEYADQLAFAAAHTGLTPAP